MIRIRIPQDEFSASVQDVSGLEHRGAVYKFYNAESELVYIGKTSDLANRIKIHASGKGKSNSTRDIYHNFARVCGFYEDDAVCRDIYETHMINFMKPSLNVDKVWTYESERYDPKYLSKDAIEERESMLKAIEKLDVGL